MLVAIDEASPHDDTTVRAYCVGEHVGTVGMGAVVVAGTGLSFAIGLDEKASEVGYDVIYLLCLLLPPLCHLRIERVGSL